MPRVSLIYSNLLIYLLLLLQMICIISYSIDGNLSQIIENKIKSGDSFTEAEIMEYMIEISKGVEYCHRHKSSP